MQQIQNKEIITINMYLQIRVHMSQGLVKYR